MAPILVTKNENEDIVDRFPGVKPHSISGGDCFIAVPLVFQERLIGIYHLISRENAIYTHRHLDIATRIGNQIAGAVANAQMYENLEDTASELAVGDRIADIMTSTADDGELYKKFSDEIGRLVAFDRITINRIDTYTQSFTPIYIGGIQVPERRVGMTLPLEGTITQYVLDSGQTILDENIRDGSRITADRSHIKGRFRSSISVPLRSEGQIMNTLHLQSKKTGAYGPDEMAIIERYADRIAPAIENARLDAETHRHAEETAAMAKIGRTVSASLDINEVYEHLGEDIRRLVPFDHLSISLINHDAMTTTPKWLFGTQVPGRRSCPEAIFYLAGIENKGRR